MFRNAAPRLVMAILIGAATAALSAGGAGAAPVDTPVRVGDRFFDPANPEIIAGDTVTWTLDPAATEAHWIAIDLNNDNTVDDQEKALGRNLVPGGDDTTFTWRFDEANPQKPYLFICVWHWSEMQGTVLVKNGPPPPPSTTTTTEPPPTTTTTEPPTTTTTAPPSTTSTTRTTSPSTTQPPATTSTTRPATTPTTQPSSQGSGPTTSSTARATTTTGEPATSTTAKPAKTKKAKPSTSTTEPETTTTSDGTIFEADWIPRPDIVPDGETTDTDSDEAAAGPNSDGSGKGKGGGGLPVVPLAGGLGAALLGGGGWVWRHRSSRYLPA